MLRSDYSCIVLCWSLWFGAIAITFLDVAALLWAVYYFVLRSGRQKFSLKNLLQDDLLRGFEGGGETKQSRN